jgi:hypothetical protein
MQIYALVAGMIGAEVLPWLLVAALAAIFIYIKRL